jgi:hypothetical protein
MNATRLRIGIALASLVVALFCAGGCSTGAQGDRCNPSLSHDECGAGLACQRPVDCPENYCCPPPGSGTAITSDFCKPGCNGGQASICAAGGDADCWELEQGGEDGGAGEAGHD